VHFKSEKKEGGRKRNGGSKWGSDGPRKGESDRKGLEKKDRRKEGEVIFQASGALRNHNLGGREREGSGEISLPGRNREYRTFIKAGRKVMRQLKKGTKEPAGKLGKGGDNPILTEKQTTSNQRSKKSKMGGIDKNMVTLKKRKMEP